MLQSSSLENIKANDFLARDSVGDQADRFFDDSYVHEIRLYFDDPNWYDTLYDSQYNNTESPYFPARFVYNNTVLDPVGVRFKGFSSFRSPGIKKPFQIDFNEYQEEDTNIEENTFFGLKKLNLNNGFKDPSMIREKLFWDFANQYVTAIRAVHTRLFINDEYYGLYTAVEQIDHTFIESRFGNDENGNLYKAEVGTLVNFGLDPELYNGPYELKTNLEENNWAELIDLTYVLTNISSFELPDRLEPIFNIESGLSALALLNIFSSLDSYLSSGRNFYLYDRDDTGQFTFLLWDANEAFGGFTMGITQGEDLTTLDPFWFPELGPGGFPPPPPDGFPPPPDDLPPPPPGGFPPPDAPPPPG
ncbi:MAG: CotH kinase family protein, partial [Melioribacteraceae bacterium]|nr:CotH kinase family protein [Melioribacteraceae bacterium]